MWTPDERTRDLVARACIVILFTLLCLNLLGDFLHTGRVTGLLLLTGEALETTSRVLGPKVRRTAALTLPFGVDGIVVVAAFESAQALVDQMGRDVATTRRVLGEPKL